MTDSRQSIVTASSVSGTTVGATHETGETTPFVNTAHSVWYSWSPSVSGSYLVSLAGSSFDTVLAVYTNTNSSVSGTVLVSWNDDCNGVLTSCVTLTSATAGVTYAIQVDGYGGASGSVMIAVSASTTVSSPSATPTPLPSATPQAAGGPANDMVAR